MRSNKISHNQLKLDFNATPIDNPQKAIDIEKSVKIISINRDNNFNRISYVENLLKQK